MKICAYVPNKFTKQAYSKECFNTRVFAGLSVVIDILKRAGYEVEYASSVNVSRYDVVLVSITSDCDWWGFIAERTKWEGGKYKVIVGGQGVLNVRPFLSFVDYFVLGRAEGIIDGLVKSIDEDGDFENCHVINSRTFSVEKDYFINQVDYIYPHDVELESGKTYHEDTIGCNHKCFYCGYTWQRKHNNKAEFEYSGLWNGGADRERAMIDMANGIEVDLNKLRTTAIDGLSERLRFAANKRISRDMLRDFIERLSGCEKPHQVKFYNIIGYPQETTDDWFEFKDDIASVDHGLTKRSKQTSILLHSTPFRAMPATPWACKPMSYRNYRGEIGRILGKGLKGNIFYQGNSVWAVESMGTESLPTVTQSAIVWRGTEDDTGNIVKLSRSAAFGRASAAVKQATLEKYFDVDKLFSTFDAQTLPTRYLNTYTDIKRWW